MKRTLRYSTTLLKHSKWVILALATTIYSCRDSNNSEPVEPNNPSQKASEFLGDLATKWADMDLKLIRNAPGFTPPVAARALGYAGLTMYETILGGIDGANSLSGQLNGLKELPKIEPDKEYNWAISFNAGQWYMAKNLWPNANDAAKKSVDSLGTSLLDALKMGTKPEVVTRSTAYGEAVAKAIFEWSKTDGGHEGFNRNFPSTFKVPVCAGCWQPTENGRQIPLQPFWGRNRTFIASNATLPMPAPLPVSTQVNSEYFKQYMAVYQKNLSLTQTEKEIAVWWADDPSETFTPPGHSYNLATIAIRSTNAKLDKAAETYARVGLAVADAFIVCWKCKYAFNNERPYTFVRRAIAPNWIPFWPAPPFPGYTSGHATQSSSTATVMEAIYGEQFAFVDNSHVGRLRDAKRNVDFKARSFKSFREAAEESAYSRFLGGIHTMQDNNTGLVEGRKIGAAVNALKWKK